MLSKDIINYIDRTVLCWLATASADNMPNVSPKEIFTHYQDKFILVANIASPQTVKNIAENNNVCISFIDIFIQKGFQVKGKAKLINRSDDKFEELAKPLIEIAGDKFPIACVIQIEMNTYKPIIAPRYFLFPDTSEQEQIEAAKKLYLGKEEEK